MYILLKTVKSFVLYTSVHLPTRIHVLFYNSPFKPVIVVKNNALIESSSICNIVRIRFLVREMIVSFYPEHFYMYTVFSWQCSVAIISFQNYTSGNTYVRIQTIVLTDSLYRKTLVDIYALLQRKRT